MPKNRKSIRLKHYDYSSEGGYFITICTHNRFNLFGQIINGALDLNEFGTIVRDEWLKTSRIRPNVSLDECVVMPNHFHAILFIDQRGAVLHTAEVGLQSPSQTIGAIVRGFKSATTRKIDLLRKPTDQPVWQANYYDRVMRNENELNETRQYIQNNPLAWDLDENNIS